MAFTSKDRQRIIDDYLTRSGRNLFVPGEFIDWLAGQKDHEAYEWFFSKTDAEAAREYRIGLARRMASGLRIVVKSNDSKARVVSITQREYPAYISPIDQRKNGGGYQRFDPQDAANIAELKRQGRVAMQSWLDRYGAAFEADGVDISALKEIADQKISVAVSA